MPEHFNNDQCMKEDCNKNAACAEFCQGAAGGAPGSTTAAAVNDDCCSGDMNCNAEKCHTSGATSASPDSSH